jgi:hypothetical protein
MNKSIDHDSEVTGMKKILFLCLLLVGCDPSVDSPGPDREVVRISYINSLSPEKAKEILIACAAAQWCYNVIEKQMKYEQYTYGVQK